MVVAMVAMAAISFAQEADVQERNFGYGFGNGYGPRPYGGHGGYGGFGYRPQSLSYVYQHRPQYGYGYEIGYRNGENPSEETDTAAENIPANN